MWVDSFLQPELIKNDCLLYYFKADFWNRLKNHSSGFSISSLIRKTCRKKKLIIRGLNIKCILCFYLLLGEIHAFLYKTYLIQLGCGYFKLKLVHKKHTNSCLQSVWAILRISNTLGWPLITVFLSHILNLKHILIPSAFTFSIIY